MIKCTVYLTPSEIAQCDAILSNAFGRDITVKPATNDRIPTSSLTYRQVKDILTDHFLRTGTQIQLTRRIGICIWTFTISHNPYTYVLRKGDNIIGESGTLHHITTILLDEWAGH